MRCSCNLFFVTYGREGGYRKADDAEASGKEEGDTEVSGKEAGDAEAGNEAR